MWHGKEVRLHPGTICIVSAPERDFDEEQVAVKSYDKKKSKWHVTLQHARWNGKELFVPESSLRLSFCILPEALEQCKQHVQFVDERAQGSCGRGLAVASPVAPGTPLFEEPPLLISPTSTKAFNEDRWRAYVTLSVGAQQGEQASAALAAFDDLGIADKMNQSVEAAAARILEQALVAAGAQTMDPDEKAMRTSQARASPPDLSSDLSYPHDASALSTREVTRDISVTSHLTFDSLYNHCQSQPARPSADPRPRPRPHNLRRCATR